MLSKKMLGRTRKELDILKQVEDNIDVLSEAELRKVLKQVTFGYKQILIGIKKNIENGQIK